MIRRSHLAFALIAAAGIGTAVAQSGGDAEARVPLEAYILGHRTGDASHMDRAFHPSARMTYMADTGMVTVPITDYIGGMRSRGPRAQPDTFPRRIAVLDVAGTAAVARIEMTFPKVTFVDYMTLLKFSDGWRIVNKTFHREAR